MAIAVNSSLLILLASFTFIVNHECLAFNVIYSFLTKALVGPDNLVNSKKAEGKCSASSVIKFIGDYGFKGF